MFYDASENLLLVAAGALLLGWLVGRTGAWLGRRGASAAARDPRDDRIRSLGAELRVARRDRDQCSETLERNERELDEARGALAERNATIEEQAARLEKLQTDLKNSMRTTEELRAELTERAEEHLWSTARLRQVETELSVARATTDLFATGELDYTVADDDEDPAEVPSQA